MNDETKITPFSLYLATVTGRIAADNYKDINTYIESCVLSYDKNYAEVTAAQMVQLLNVIWGSKPDINFHPLHRVMRPILDGSMGPDFLAAHYEDPGLVRSLLMLSSIMDGSKPDVDSVPPSVKPKVEKLLSSVHATQSNCALLGTHLERTGYALLGNTWYVLQSLLDLPKDVQWKFCEALRQVPDSLLNGPNHKPTNVLPLPSALTFE